MANDYSSQNSPPTYTDTVTESNSTSLEEGLYQLGKYQAIADELAQINQDQLQHQTLSQVIETLHQQPVADFQRAQTVAHIRDFLTHPNRSPLTQQERSQLQRLNQAVNQAIKTTSTTDELTDSIYQQIKDDRQFDVPDRDTFQTQTGTLLSQQVPDIEAYQQVASKLRQQADALDPDTAINSIINNPTVTTQITSTSIQAELLSPTPLTPDDFQKIIQQHAPDLSLTEQKQILTVLTVDQELLQTTPLYHRTQQQYQADQITAKDLPLILAANQMTSQDFRRSILFSSERSSNQNQAPFSIPSPQQALRIYRQFQTLQSSSSPVSFWRSPAQWLKNTFSNLGSSGQTGLRQLFNPTTGSSPSFNLPQIRSNLGGGFGSVLKDGLSSLSKGLGGLGNTATKAASALGKLGSLAGKVGSKALLAAATSPWGWVAILVVLLIIIILVLILPSANTQLAANISPVGGQGSGGMGLGFCDPELEPETCIVTSCEGSCRCPTNCGSITQGPMGGHSHRGASNAIDIGISSCDDRTIFAVMPGYVSFAGWNDYGYGNLVIVTHDDGTQMYYAHLEAFVVNEGDPVSVGTRLGIGDSTGNSTGHHLHIEWVNQSGPPPQNIINLFNFNVDPEIINNCSSDVGCGACI